MPLLLVLQVVYMNIGNIYVHYDEQHQSTHHVIRYKATIFIFMATLKLVKQWLKCCEIYYMVDKWFHQQ